MSFMDPLESVRVSTNASPSLWIGLAVNDRITDIALMVWKRLRMQIPNTRRQWNSQEAANEIREVIQPDVWHRHAFM